MMRTKRYEATATIIIGDVEEDRRVRCYVEIETSRSRGVEAHIDGDVEVFVPETDSWRALFDFDEVDAESAMRAEEAVLAAALEDDSDACGDELADEERRWA